MAQQPKTGRAGKAPKAAAAPAVEAVKAPRLVGDDAGPAKPFAEQAAQPGATEIAQDQGDTPADEEKIIQIDRLSQFLVERPGFVPAEGGELTDAAIIRVIGEQDASIAVLLAAAKEEAAAVIAAGAAFEPLGLLLMQRKVAGKLTIEADERMAGPAIRLIEGLEGEVAALKAQIAELSANPETGDGAVLAKKDLGKAVKNLAELFEDLPDTAAITLRFADGDEFVRTVPPRDVDRAELVAAGSKVALNARIAFDPGLPSATVTAAFLIAGKKTLRCAVGPLSIGGGAQACIPAGFLEF